MSAKQIDVAAKHIEIVPMGNIDDEVIRFLEKAIKQKFGLSTGIWKQMPVPAATYDRSRNQHNSRMILTEMEKKHKDKGSNKVEAEKSTREIETKHLAVINDDLYIDGLNYVFGQAILNGCCAVISLTRLHRDARRSSGSDMQLFFSRIEKEAVHELGHVFGLRHCPNSKCVMYLSGDIADTDRKSANFCTVCDDRLFLPGCSCFRRIN